MNRILFLFLTFFVFTNTLFAINLTTVEKDYLLEHKSITFTGDPNWLPFEALFFVTIIFGLFFYRHHELKKYNSKLSKQKELYDLVYENSSNGVLLIESKTGTITDCNNQIIKILKYSSKKDILNLHLSQLSPQFQPDGNNSDKKANKMMNLAMQNGSNTFEWKHIRATGEEFWSEIILTSIFLDGKNMIHVVWKDIDDRKKSREKLEELNNNLEDKVQEATLTLAQQNSKLQESVNNFQNILDITMEGIVLIDENRNIIDINQSAINMLGYQYKSDIVDTYMFTYILPSELPKLQEAMSHDAVEPYELILVKKDGTSLPTLASAKNIIRDGKKIRMSMIMDISEIKTKEKMLQQQSRLAQMGEMISMIAHQWRQPLSAISSSVIGIQAILSIGKYDLKVDEDRDKFLQFLDQKHKNINDYVQTLSETIDDFRTFFKPDKQKEVISISEPINKALKIVKTSMSNRGIDISCDFQTEDKLLMYQNELMQVVLNILKNSEDNFIERDISNGKIFIKTFRLNRNHIIEISDNGGGIPKDIMPKIFDPYFSTKDEKNGTGLGLYMSKIMIEEHLNGKFNVSNTNDGVVFSIEFNS